MCSWAPPGPVVTSSDDPQDEITYLRGRSELSKSSSGVNARKLKAYARDVVRGTLGLHPRVLLPLTLHQ